MNPVTAWRTLSRHPIYLRERGQWGEANPIYERIRRYSPFAIMGAILLGACAAGTNTAWLSGNQELFAFWCFLCLPGIFLSALTLFGSLMAPALTAPSISRELDLGSWDLLRVTPTPARTILLAKLFGGLARLRLFWRLLVIMSLFQGLIVAGAMSLAAGRLALYGWLVGLCAAARPWLEVMFAACCGMIASTWTRSAATALAGSYTAVVLFRLLNSGPAWAALVGWGAGADVAALAGLVLPTVAYLLATVAGGWGLLRRADRLAL